MEARTRWWRTDPDRLLYPLGALLAWAGVLPWLVFAFGRAELYRPLFAGMQRSFGYNLLAPVRRDFSVVLGQCGHDLDRALAHTTARADYTAIEHARDLAGALRWNAATALRTRARV